eukprot:PhM_4_TR15941/c0_g1_i1/m.50195
MKRTGAHPDDGIASTKSQHRFPALAGFCVGRVVEIIIDKNSTTQGGALLLVLAADLELCRDIAKAQTMFRDHDGDDDNELTVVNFGKTDEEERLLSLLSSRGEACFVSSNTLPIGAMMEENICLADTFLFRPQIVQSSSKNNKIHIAAEILWETHQQKASVDDDDDEDSKCIELLPLLLSEALKKSPPGTETAMFTLNKIIPFMASNRSAWQKKPNHISVMLETLVKVLETLKFDAVAKLLIDTIPPTAALIDGHMDQIKTKNSATNVINFATWSEITQRRCDEHEMFYRAVSEHSNDNDTVLVIQRVKGFGEDGQFRVVFTQEALKQFESPRLVALIIAAKNNNNNNNNAPDRSLFWFVRDDDDDKNIETTAHSRTYILTSTSTLSRARQCSAFLQLLEVVESDALTLQLQPVPNGSIPAFVSPLRSVVKSVKTCSPPNGAKVSTTVGITTEEQIEEVLKCVVTTNGQSSSSAVALCGPSGTGKTFLAVNAARSLKQRLASPIPRKQAITNFQNAQKLFVSQDDNKNETNLCSSALSLAQSLRIVMDAQRGEVVPLVIGSVPFATTTNLNDVLRSEALCSKYQHVLNSLQAQSKRLSKLLKAIGQTIWHVNCPTNNQLSVCTILSAFTAIDESLDKVLPLTQEALDAWTGLHPTDLLTSTMLDDSNNAVFTVPPPLGIDTSSTSHEDELKQLLHLRSVWDLTDDVDGDDNKKEETERERFVRLCQDVALAALEKAYIKTFHKLQLIQETISEVFCDRTALARVVSSGLFSISLTSLICSRHASTLTYLLSPTIVIADVPKCLSSSTSVRALFQSIVASTSSLILCNSHVSSVSADNDDFIRHKLLVNSVFLLQQQWRHGDEVMRMLRDLRGKTSASDASASFGLQTIQNHQSSAQSGVKEQAFVWMSATAKSDTLLSMGVSLTHYLTATSPSTVLTVPSSTTSLIERQNAIKVLTYSELTGMEIDCLVIVVLSTNTSLNDIISLVAAARFRVYIIAPLRWCQVHLSGDTILNNSDKCSVALHLVCPKHESVCVPRPVFVEYDFFSGDEDGKDTFSASLEFPSFGEWCEMICGERFKGHCSTPSHTCETPCNQCRDDHNECPYPCERVHEKCGHVCQKQCKEDCGLCAVDVVEEVPCEGTQILIGYDVHTKQGKYRVFPHYQEVKCGEGTTPCQEVVTRQCGACSADVQNIICSLGVPSSCAACRNFTPAVVALLKEKNELTRRQRAIALNKDMPQEVTMLIDTEVKRVDLLKRKRLQMIARAQEVNTAHNTAAAQRATESKAKSTGMMNDLNERSKFMADFVKKSYQDHCQHAQRLSEST